MDAQPSPFASRAVRATKDSSSLRVTVPQVIASTLGLRAGDDLIWIVEPVSGDVHVRCLRRDVVEGDPELSREPDRVPAPGPDSA